MAVENSVVNTTNFRLTNVVDATAFSLQLVFLLTDNEIPNYGTMYSAPFTFVVVPLLLREITGTKISADSSTMHLRARPGALPQGGLRWTRPPHFFPMVFLGLSRCGAFW